MGKNYYIIGSKYGRHDDKYPEMLDIDAVSIGFSRQFDMSDWYGASEMSIIEYLRSLEQDKTAYYNLKLFLNIRPGDLIAIKVAAHRSATWHD